MFKFSLLLLLYAPIILYTPTLLTIVSDTQNQTNITSTDTDADKDLDVESGAEALRIRKTPARGVPHF